MWDGKVPPDIAAAARASPPRIDQPQLNSAWARQQVALVKQQLGNDWEPRADRGRENRQARRTHASRGPWT